MTLEGVACLPYDVDEVPLPGSSANYGRGRRDCLLRRFFVVFVRRLWAAERALKKSRLS